MSVNIINWKRELIKVIESLADKDNLYFSWSRGGFSSPEETYCQIFDDMAIEAFLKRTDTDLTDAGIDVGNKLVNQLNDFSIQFEKICPEDILNNPAWVDIQKNACIFAEYLKGDPRHNQGLLL